MCCVAHKCCWWWLLRSFFSCSTSIDIKIICIWTIYSFELFYFCSYWFLCLCDWMVNIRRVTDNHLETSPFAAHDVFSSLFCPFKSFPCLVQIHSTKCRRRQYKSVELRWNTRRVHKIACNLINFIFIFHPNSYC